MYGALSASATVQRPSSSSVTDGIERDRRPGQEELLLDVARILSAVPPEVCGVPSIGPATSTSAGSGGPVVLVLDGVVDVGAAPRPTSSDEQAPIVTMATTTEARTTAMHHGRLPPTFAWHGAPCSVRNLFAMNRVCPPPRWGVTQIARTRW